MQRLFFLSGINRSGSTVLGSILNQNPDFLVTPISPLMDVMMAAEHVVRDLSNMYTFDYRQKIQNLLESYPHIYYKDVDKKYVVDNHRGWANNIGHIKKDIDPNARIICTYRPIAEVVTSMIGVIQADPNNMVDKELKKNQRPLTTKNRAMVAWDYTIRTTWEAFHNGLCTNPESMHLINYHDLCADPDRVFFKLYEFLGVPQFKHQYDHIENTLEGDKDEMMGFKNLHKIRTQLGKTSKDPRQVLGDELVEYFNKYDRQLRIPK